MAENLPNKWVNLCDGQMMGKIFRKFSILLFQKSQKKKLKFFKL